MLCFLQERAVFALHRHEMEEEDDIVFRTSIGARFTQPGPPKNIVLYIKETNEAAVRN